MEWMPEKMDGTSGTRAAEEDAAINRKYNSRTADQIKQS
jgi:hypothetical protein